MMIFYDDLMNDNSVDAIVIFFLLTRYEIRFNICILF